MHRFIHSIHRLARPKIASEADAHHNGTAEPISNWLAGNSLGKLTYLMATASSIKKARGGHQGVQLYLKTLVSYFFSFGNLKEALQAPCMTSRSVATGLAHSKHII